VGTHAGKAKFVMLNTNIYEQNTYFIQLILTTVALITVITVMFELVYTVLDKEGCVYTDDMGDLQQNRDLLKWFTCTPFCPKSK
jgi:hypothetical protein